MIYADIGQAVTDDRRGLEWFRLADGVSIRRIDLPIAAFESVAWMRRSPDGRKISVGLLDRKRETRPVWEISADGSAPQWS